MSVRFHPNADSSHLREFNSCHTPGGPKGGQFCSKDEAAPQPSGTEDREAWQEYWNKEKDWTRQMTQAVSLGRISPEDARRLGWRPDSNAGEKGYQLLPQTLYHVSTGFNNILRQGLRTREEIGGEHRGLGGGTDDTVSFTTDLKTARAIRSAILEARRVVRGEITPAQMLRMAKAQPTVDPSTPRAKYMQSQGPASAYEMLVTMYNGKTWHMGDPFPENLTRLMNGTVAEDPTYSKHPDLAGLKGTFGVPVSQVPKGMKVLNQWNGRDEAFTNRIERPMTRDEHLDAAWEMYKRYAMAREYAGGRMDPLFFMTDREALAKVPVKDIKIMQFAPRPGARGYQVSSLGEWRVNSGRTVRYTGIVESA
jgi:hypothetical protein